MHHSSWLKTEFSRLLKTTRASRKQSKLAREGRSLRVESLEPRRLLAAWVPPNLAQGEVFHGDFEHPAGFQLESRTQGSVPGNLESPYATQVHIKGSGALPEVKNGSIVPDGAGARAGNSVFESHIQKQTVPSAWYREEVIARPNGLTTPNVDYWYGFSTYYANNFQPDYSFEIHSQWFVPGTVTGGPLMSLATKSDSGGTINHNTLRLTHSTLGLIATAEMSDLKGKWTDWVVHARWSTSGSGTVEVYRDGQLIGAKNGATIRSGDVQGGFNGVPKQRLGLYKGSWKTQNQVPNAPAPTEMTVYYDEWRIARSDNGTNLFDVVDPAQGGGNISPVAFDDTATTAVNTPVTTINVLANDTDPNQGDILSVQGFTQPNKGSVVNNGDGTFTYTPDLNFNGVDTFDYTVSDGNVGSDVGTVSVTVGVIAVQSFEFESLVPATASSGDSLETKVDTAASGGEWVLYRSDAVGDSVTFTANVGQMGTFDIAMLSRLNAFRGQFQLSIDGTDVGGINDAYVASPAFGELLPLATGVNLTAGPHQFTFTVTGKNSASNDFQLSFDQLRLTLLEANNGDFDSDGDTDGADFLQWQRGLGSTHDANDLIDWQDNYGNDSVVAAATAPDPVASVSTTPIDESFAAITSSAFLLTADMFSPVASQPASDAVLDEAFAGSGESASATQQSQVMKQENTASLIFSQEEIEEEEESKAFADSLDLIFELIG